MPFDPLDSVVLLRDLPAAAVRRWEQELGAELERDRAQGMLRLGGTTRLVVARRSRSSAARSSSKSP